MQLKSYKIFLIAVLIVGGFLFWGSAGNVLAADGNCYNCCCKNGMTVPGSDCAMSCEGQGGFQSSVAYTCGSFNIPSITCSDISGLNTDADSGSNNGSTDACGGVCGEFGSYCDAATAKCITNSSAGSGRCFSDSDCNSGETCTADGCMPSNSSNNTLPGSNSNDTKPSSGFSGSAYLPNFVGVESIGELILKITKFLIALAIPFAVLMLIWAGFKFATAQGNDQKLTEAKKNLAWTVIGIAVIMASNAIIGYITEILGGGTGEGNALINTIKNVLDQIIGLLFVLVTVFFFWGIVEFVRASSSGDTGKLEEGKRHMIWGIIGMAVMASAWGIVKIIQQAF